MSCLRCTRRIVQARPSLNLPSSSLLQSTLRPLASSQPAQVRTISLLSATRPTLPTTPSSTLSLSTTLELPRTSNPSTTLTLLQARGPKRDTYDPSHRIRKRRSGFLARIRTRKGRSLIKRRRLLGRTAVSH